MLRGVTDESSDGSPRFTIHKDRVKAKVWDLSV